jgi:hypothetical protein
MQTTHLRRRLKPRALHAAAVLAAASGSRRRHQATVTAATPIATMRERRAELAGPPGRAPGVGRQRVEDSLDEEVVAAVEQRRRPHGARREPRRREERS